MRLFATAAVLSLGVMALSACSGANAPQAPASGGDGTKLPEGAVCVINSARLQVGTQPDLVIDGTKYTAAHQPDAASTIETPISNAGPQPAGSCSGNDRYRFGSGLYDTTGPIGGNPTGHADMFGNVLPTQVPMGIHTRLYARAFAIESPCNGKRVVFVSQDLQATSALIHQEVLKKIAADPVLGKFYDTNNIMLSATHTHSAGGGFGLEVLPDLSSTLPGPLNDALVYVESLLISNPNYDDDNFTAIVSGITQAIRRAHANLEAHAETAHIKLSVGQLLNANVNRDPPAYIQNSPSERAAYVDAQGHAVDTDKRFVQLNLVRDDGSVAGVINWFAVHPTSMGNHDLLISSDNKGYASLGFEKLMKTQYVADASGSASGVDNFVAAFAQTDEGDAIGDNFIFDKDLSGGNGPGQGVPYRYRAGTDDPYEFTDAGYQHGMQEATAVSGTKQLAQALKQFAQGTALSGPVDYRFFYADFSADEITDPVINASLTYPDRPAALYADPKTTCTSAYGISQFAGGVNGIDFGAAGYACGSDAPTPYFNDVRTLYNGYYNGTNALVVQQNNMPVSVPFSGVAAYTIAAPLLCAATQLQSGYGCQQEKPVTVGASSNPVPFQIFRIGNLAILGVPWEATTMSGRRLRKTVLDSLSPVGVDTVVIAGLSNDYLEYMATREEYTAQMYEGASTIAGPWQLAAAQQESRKLALTMAQGSAAPTGIAGPVLTTGIASPITTDSQADFGKIVTDVAPSYAQGRSVDAVFVAGYPGNDLKLMGSYAVAEKLNAQGGWDVVAVDRDAELSFIWNVNSNLFNTELHRSGASTGEVLWKIPANAPAGTYRLRHDGVYRLSADAPPTPYEGISSSFQIAGAPAACP
jgi:neutral ceramidase